MKLVKVEVLPDLLLALLVDSLNESIEKDAYWFDGCCDSGFMFWAMSNQRHDPHQPFASAH